ncbi:hypothetical protein B9W62_39160 [Streptomyces sp. CS113]|nr:hypothetical protein B9W62_39160 [Streptomyces sp. CS113]
MPLRTKCSAPSASIFIRSIRSMASCSMISNRPMLAPTSTTVSPLSMVMPPRTYASRVEISS